MSGEVVILVFLIAFSTYFIYLSLQLPRIAGVFIGPEAWPLTILSAILISSIAALVHRLISRRYYNPPKPGRRGLLRVSATIALVTAYALTFSYLGFFLSTLLLFPLYLRFLGVRTVYSVAAGLIFAFLALALFPVLLLIPLPRGYGVFYDITSYVLSLFGR